MTKEEEIIAIGLSYCKGAHSTFPFYLLPEPITGDIPKIRNANQPGIIPQAVEAAIKQRGEERKAFAAKHAVYRKFIGNRLIEARAALKKNKRPNRWTIQDVAAAVNRTANVRVSDTTINALENGDFSLPLGELYYIVKAGYRSDFTNLLETLYSAIWSAEKESAFSSAAAERQLILLERQFTSGGGRNPDPPFERTRYYSFYSRKPAGHYLTPILIGGDFEHLDPEQRHYIWSVPLRRQLPPAMFTEFLELAPMRRPPSRGLNVSPRGAQRDNLHLGAEVIFVVNGAVEINVSYNDDGPTGRSPSKIPLGAHQFVHLNGTYAHSIHNTQPNTTAQLFVVRTLAEPAAKTKKASL